jgi:hypothetical protein
VINRFPFLFGVLIASLLACVLLVIQVWLPWLADDLLRHQTLAQSVYFTGFFFLVAICSVWSWRERPGFWSSTCAFFLAHVLAVSIYTSHVRRILVWQWGIVLFIEGWAFVIVLVLATRRLGRQRRHRLRE